MKEFIFTIMLSVHFAAIFTAPPTSLEQQRAIAPGSIIDDLTPLMRQLEQLNIPFVKIEDDLKLLMENVSIRGMENSDIDSVTVDSAASTVTVVYRADLTVTCRYVGGGYLFELPFFGEGDFYVRLENLEVELTMPFTIIKDEQGRDVMNLEGFQYEFDVRDGAKFKLDNLFNGDQVASDEMHQLMNEHWKILTLEFGPYLFDPMNSEIFDIVRAYVLEHPL